MSIHSPEPCGTAPPGFAQSWKRGTESILLNCESLCNQAIRVVQSNVLDVPLKTESAQEFRSKATVGILLNDLAIHNIVPGGPAYNSKQISIGDLIVKVDNEKVTLDDYEMRLLGCDVPGSKVLLTVLKPEGSIVDVPLTRMARTEMADRVKMFELFTELQQILVQYGDQHHAKVLESVIALCKKMEENNAHRDTTIVHNVLDMQQTCMTALQNLNGKLKSLHSSVESHVDGYRDQIMELQVRLKEQESMVWQLQRSHEEQMSSLKCLSGEANKQFTIVQPKYTENMDLEALVQACKQVCVSLADTVKTDVLSVTSGYLQRSSPGQRSTVGIMLKDRVVDNMVIGGPAYTCKQLERGDTIIMVDGMEVDEYNFQKVLIGNDLPGSTVTLTVIQGSTGMTKDVTIRRMAREEIANHVQMFELFTQVKEVAICEDNMEEAQCVDELINLWTTMLLSEASRTDTIESNVRNMQDASKRHVQILQEGLGKISRLQNDLNDKIRELEKKLASSEKVKAEILCQLDAKRAECDEGNDTISNLLREIKAKAGELSACQAELQKKTKALEGLQAELDRLSKLSAADASRLQQAMSRLQDDLNDKIRELEKKLASSEKAKAESLCQLDAKRAECDEGNDTISNLLREIKAKAGELSACQAELQKKTKALEGLQAELDRLSKLSAADASRLQHDLQKALSDHEKLKKELELAEGELRNSKKENADLKSHSNKMEEEAARLCRELDGKSCQLDGMSRQLSGVEELLREERARTDLLDKDLQEQLAKSAQFKRDAEAAVRRLDEKVRQLNKELEELKSLNQKRLFESQKSMKDVQDDLHDKIRELEKKLASSEKAKAESLCQLDAKRAECDEGNDTISNLLREIKAKAGELSACQAELQKKTKALEGLQAELDRLSKLSAADASRLQHDLQKALSDHEKLKKELELAEGELRNSKKENADLKSHSNKMVEEKAKLCQEIERLKTELESVQGEVRNLKKENADLKSNLTGDLSKKEELLAKLRQALDDKCKELYDVQEKLRLSEASNSNAQNELNEEILIVKKEKANVQRSVMKMEEQRCRLGDKLSLKLLHRTTENIFASWSITVRIALRLRRKAGKVVGRRLFFNLSRTIKVWSQISGRKMRLREKCENVVRRWKYQTKHLKRNAVKIASRWLNQDLSCAWGTWLLMYQEAKRAHNQMRKVVKYWTNSTLARAWETWSRHRSEEKRLRNAAHKVLSRWIQKSMLMCWNTWSTNAAEKKRLQAIMLRIVEKWTRKGLTQAWSTWELKWREEKRLRNAMRKVFGRWTKTSLSKTWETWAGHAKEQKRLCFATYKIVVRMENLMLWTVWNTWASNAAELKRTNAIASKVVARWRNQTMGEVFNRWKGKSEEEKRARQVVMKIVQRWSRGCRRKAFMRWIFHVDEQCIEEQATSAGLETQKEMSSLQDVLNDKIRELEKKLASSEKAKAESLCQLDAKRAEFDEGNDTISNLLREIKAKAGELSACQAELQKTAKALEGLQAELGRLSKLSAADASRLQHDLQKALSDHEKLRKELELAEGELRNSKKENTDLKSLSNKMEEEAARLCKELDGKSCQLDGMSRQLSEAEKLQLERLAELRDSEAALRSVEENLRELNKEMKVSRRSGLQAARNLFLEERLLAAELLMSPDTQRAKYGTLIQAFQEHLEIIDILRDELKSFKNSLVQYISKKKAASGFRKALYSWHYYVQEEIRLERAGQIIVKRRNNQVHAKMWSTWYSATRKTKKLKRNAVKIASRWLNQDLSCAWGTWLLMYQEAKRAHNQMRKVVKYWTNSTLARAWETWSRHRSEEKRLRNAAHKVLSRWIQKSMLMCWNTWSTNAAEKKRLQAIMLRIVEKWTRKGLTQAWSTWELKWREEKRLRNAMRKVFGRWTKTSLSKTWETWAGHAKEQGRMVKVAGRIVVRMENLMLWTVWNTWASNAAELKRTNAIASKVVARWRNQTMGEVFNRWKGKSEEEKRARQVVMKIVQRWSRGCQRKAFMRWIFHVDERINEEQRSLAMSVQRAGQQQEKQLQDALSSMSAENQKIAEELATKDSLAKQLHSSLAVKIAAIAQLEEDLRSAERIVDSVQRDVQGIREDADILKRTMLVVCQTKIVLLEKEIYRLRGVVDEEREKRAKAEHEQRETELRNIECEKLMQEAENKLAKIKKQLALELVIKETELSRLQEQQKESDTQYGYIRAWLDHPVAVALTYDADFDEVAATPEAADQFNAQVHEQVSAALGIPKTAVQVICYQRGRVTAEVVLKRVTRPGGDSDPRPPALLAQELVGMVNDCSSILHREDLGSLAVKSAVIDGPIAQQLADRVASCSFFEYNEPNNANQEDEDDVPKAQKRKDKAQRCAPPPSTEVSQNLSWKDMLLRARNLSTTLQKRVRDDVLAVQNHHRSSSEGMSQSTLGIMFDEKKGNSDNHIHGYIENVMIGGPAYTSRNIFKGDIIVKVDGEFVHEQVQDLKTLIVGDDIPGTSVTLTIKRGPGELVDVTLMRASTEDVADNRRIFDVFTKLSDKAKKTNDTDMLNCVEEGLLAWEKSLNAEYEYNNKLVDNIRAMQDDCTPMSDELHSIIDTIGKMQGWDEFLKVEQEDVIPLCTIYYESGQLNDDSWFSPNAKPGHATKQSPFSREGFSPNVKQEHQQRNPQAKDIVAYCEFLCTLLEEAISNDVLSVPADSISSRFSTKATVGIMLLDVSIDNMVVGGPAYNCQHLKKGDIILKVDDEDVNVNNITDKLVGSDIPGSFVKLLVFSPGGPQKVPEEKEVILTRMATVTIADNVRMFEIFAALKDRALKDGGHYGVGQVIMSEEQGSIMMLIDDCIALWSRMLLNTADTNCKVLNNVISLQKNCIRWVQDLRFSFRRLRREGYQKQGDKSDQISEWLLGYAPGTKRPTPAIGTPLFATPSYIPLDESRGLFRSPAVPMPRQSPNSQNETLNLNGKQTPKYFAF